MGHAKPMTQRSPLSVLRAHPMEVHRIKPDQRNA